VAGAVSSSASSTALEPIDDPGYQGALFSLLKGTVAEISPTEDELAQTAAPQAVNILADLARARRDAQLEPPDSQLQADRAAVGRIDLDPKPWYWYAGQSLFFRVGVLPFTPAPGGMGQVAGDPRRLRCC